MSAPQPELSAVFVSWNSGESLRASIGALRHSAARTSAQVEVVVVDNASTDDSVAVSRAEGADVVVENPLNAGYVVAASQGIARARAPWIMLANPDLVVDEAFLPRMLETMRDASPDVACLVPDIRYAADPSVVNSRGIAVDTTGIPAEQDAGRAARPVAEEEEVFGVSTAGCLLRRSALAEAGGLEPLYFAYLEDVDVSWRLRKLGYRALVVPGAVALHEGSASVGEGSWLKTFLVARNRRALFRLHGPFDLRARALRAVTEVGHASVQALSGTGTASVHGRLAARGSRRYTRFLRASNRTIGIPDDAVVALAARPKLGDHLRRKRSAESLMRRGSRDGSAPLAARRPSRPGPKPATSDTKLRVLVDATNLKPGQGGIRTYTIGLLEGLAAQPELELVVVSSIDEVAGLGPLELVEAPTRTRTVAARALWREQQLARLAQSTKADVVLVPVPELPVRGLPLPSVVVVHDVGPLVAPAFYSVAKRLRYRAMLPRSCRLANAVVCVSQTTLLGLNATTGIDPGRCIVIGEAPPTLAAPREEATAAEPYFLYVGSLDPRKNVATLVKAFDAPSTQLPGRLLAVGPIEGRPTALSRRLARSRAGDAVQHLGFVSPERLSELYRNATAIVLPSVYEGYGLPLLEAMAHGIPVVASDIPSAREVAGDAALYVERPLDPSAWHEALTRVATEGELREKLARDGVAAAAAFTWAEVGARFTRLLQRVAPSKKVV